MTHELKPYPAYKDSGVPWLGDVPEHWDIRRIKTLLKERSEKGYPDEPLLAATQTKGVVRKEQYENRTVLALKDLHLLKLVRINDFVISLRSFQGGIEYAHVQGIISPAYTILYPVSPEMHGFLAKLFKSRPFIDNLTLFVTGIRQGQNIDYQKLSRSGLPVPPAAEQAAIVRYLDYMDRRIRRYIRAKQKLIRLLEEQKQSIIHQAVTGQIDVRTGQPYPAYKASGVEWLGEVPEHWDMRQTRRLFSFVTSGSRGWASYYSDEGDLFIQSGNLGRAMALDLSRVQHVTPPVSAEGIRTKVQQDDVLICITGALTGNVIIVDQELPVPSFVNQHVALCRPKKGVVNPRFLAFALHSDTGKKQFRTNEYGGTKQGLGLDEVKNVIVPLPPNEEQAQICVYLDNMVEMLERAKQTRFQEITLVREYHTRLIANVVTGKLDVRQAAAGLPEEMEEPDILEDEDDIDAADDATEDDLDEAIEEEAA